MTFWGILIVDLVGLFFLAWILNLIRVGRLYVGYAALLLLAIGGIIVTISIPRLGDWLFRGIQWLFPENGLLVLACGVLALILIYVLSQITIISNRLSTVVQELAMRDVAKSTKKDESAANGSSSTAQE